MHGACGCTFFLQRDKKNENTTPTDSMKSKEKLHRFVQQCAFIHNWFYSHLFKRDATYSFSDFENVVPYAKSVISYEMDPRISFGNVFFGRNAKCEAMGREAFVIFVRLTAFSCMRSPIHLKSGISRCCNITAIEPMAIHEWQSGR